MAASANGVRQQIAFYGSTPAYRAVLELHGWGDLQDELNRLSKQGEWARWASSSTTTILDTFAVVGRARAASPAQLHGRYGDLVDRISFYAPYETDPDTWLPVVEALQRGVSIWSQSDDDVDQLRRPGDDLLAASPPSRCACDLRSEASAERLGLGLVDAGVDLDAVAHLAVDLHDHRDGVDRGHGRRRRPATAASWTCSPAWRRSHSSAVMCGRHRRQQQQQRCRRRRQGAVGPRLCT